MQKFTACLWFDNQAEEAVQFYMSAFSAAGKKDSRIMSIARYGGDGAKASGKPEGSVMTIAFKLNGMEFLALNGGPHFKFSPAISFIVNCTTQKEVDHLWEKLSAGGAKDRCGWLKDKYGMSWQIVPAVLRKMMKENDSKRSARVMHALLQMTKLDIKLLKQAYEKK